MKTGPLIRSLAGLAAITAAGNGLFALLAWSQGHWNFTTFGTEYVPMAPITAFLFVLLGLTAAARVRWPRSHGVRLVGVFGAVLAISIGALAAGQSWFLYSLPWDQWLLPAPTNVRAIPIGVMAPLTAFTFLLSAGACLTLNLRTAAHFATGRAVAVTAALTALLIGFIVVVSYASGTPLQYGSQTVPMAWLTGLAFMALNSATLLASLAETRLFGGIGDAAAPPAPEEIHSFSRRLLLVGTVTASLIALAGVFHLRKEQTAARKTAGAELDAIANLKAEQILSWRNERLGEARFLLKARGVVDDIAAFAARPDDPVARTRVLSWLEPIKGGTRYESISVFTPRGGVLLALPDSASSRTTLSPDLMAATLASPEPIFTDLQRDPDSLEVHLSLLVAIRPASGQTAPAPSATAPVAVIAFRLNPKQFLFPLVESWPIPSTTAENLLVRREGDEVVYLNELRHQPGVALTLRRPIHDPALPAALGAKGVVGLIEGRDYRGAAVLATIRHIPDSPWIMVCKIDQAEIYAPLRQAALLNGALVVSLLLTLALAGFFLWRQRYVSSMRRALEAERERNTLSERLALLTRHANDIIFLFDEDRRIVEANERALASYGRTLEEMRQLKAEDLRALPAAARVTADYEAAHQPDGITFETRHRRKDGTEFPVEVSARMVVIEGRRHILSIVRDITERKNAEEKLRRSEESLAITLQSIGDAVIATDAAGRVTRMNSMAERMTGWPLADAQGRPLTEVFRIINAETRAPNIDPVQLVMERGEIVGLANHTALLARGGREFLISDSAAPIRDAAGVIVGVVLVFSDVTEKYRTEAALRESEEKFSKVFRRAPVLIVLSDLESGRCLEVNDEVLRASGFTREEVIGRTSVELGWLSAEARTQLAKGVKQQGRVDDLEMILRTKTGELRSGLITAESMLIGGRPCLLTVTVDITEQTTTEATLRESEEKFATAFRDSPVPMAIRDMETDLYLDANDRCLAMMGYGRAEVIGRSPLEIGWMAEADREANRQSLATTSNMTDRELRLRRKDGTTVICSYSTHMIPIGGRRCVLSTSIDITDQKRAEEALRASEQNYRRLFDSMLDGFAVHEIICDAAGRPVDYRFLSVNPAFERLTGLRAADTVGRTVREIMPQTEPGWIERYGRVALTGEGVEFEDYSNALQKHFEIAAFRPNPGQFATVFIDITARKQAESALRASEQRYRSILNASPDDITIADLQGRILLVSPAGVKMFGYEREDDFLLRPVTDALVPADQPLASSRIALMFQGIMPGVNEYRGLRRDGSIFDFEVNSKFIEDETGKPTHIIFVARDITTRKRTEEALRESEARNKALISAIPDLIFTNRRDGEFLAVHAPDPSLLFIRPEFFLHCKVDQVLPPAVAESFLRAYAAACDTSAMQALDYVLPVKGQDRHFEARVVPSSKDTVITIVRDITERTQAQAALQSSLREKEALLKEVHHRVKNNLQVITSLLRLEAGRSTQPGIKSVLGDMQGRIRSMAMLHESLYRSGTFAAVDLAAYLKQVATQLFRALVAAPGAIQLHLDLAPTPVEMDQAMPCGLLVNELVTNALKHGFPNGRTGEVRLELQRVPGSAQLRLTVSDTGVGLPANWESVCNQSLGLQLVGDLTRQVEGSLETGSGPGTRFTITFTPHQRTTALPFPPPPTRP